ncbi:MAG: transglutaminase family protein [Pseudomonadota bacterium]
MGAMGSVSSGAEAATSGERVGKRRGASVSTDLLEVRHTTTYRYSEPVEFGPHRAMFRPHDSHDLRLLGIEITASPQASLRWLHDAFSNSITTFEFSEPADTLSVSSVFQVVRSTIHEPDFPIAESAQRYPFNYDPDQRVDLSAAIAPEYDHPSEMVREWARSFADENGCDTWSILESMVKQIHSGFRYERREEAGVQAPRETLELQCGSCRDFAVLMMEGVRQLGFAARFVTGYLYDPLSDKEGVMRGAGATHAWVQVFLPGAGWVEFDPTNGLIASGNLIRTGVARRPSQAAPFAGSFKGPSQAFVSLDVTVDVRALAPTLTG